MNEFVTKITELEIAFGEEYTKVNLKDFRKEILKI